MTGALNMRLLRACCVQLSPWGLGLSLLSGHLRLDVEGFCDVGDIHALQSRTTRERGGRQQDRDLELTKITGHC